LHNWTISPLARLVSREAAPTDASRTPAWLEVAAGRREGYSQISLLYVAMVYNLMLLLFMYEPQTQLWLIFSAL
jgi:hypothetical protein